MHPKNGKFQNGISNYFETKYHTKHKNRIFQNEISRYFETKFHTKHLINVPQNGKFQIKYLVIPKQNITQGH